MAESSRKKKISWKKGRKSRERDDSVKRGGGKERRGTRKLFRYETHRAAYRVKGANFKKPLPRLSVPRCGGIKIQKEELTSWGLERHRKERGGRRGEEGAKSAKRRKCLGLVNFLVICPTVSLWASFLSDRASSPFPPASFYRSSFSSCSNEKVGEILSKVGIRKNRLARTRKTTRDGWEEEGGREKAGD